MESSQIRGHSTQPQTNIPRPKLVRPPQTERKKKYGCLGLKTTSMGTALASRSPKPRRPRNLSRRKAPDPARQTKVAQRGQQGAREGEREGEIEKYGHLISSQHVTSIPGECRTMRPGPQTGTWGRGGPDGPVALEQGRPVAQPGIYSPRYTATESPGILPACQCDRMQARLPDQRSKRKKKERKNKAKERQPTAPQPHPVIRRGPRISALSETRDNASSSSHARQSDTRQAGPTRHGVHDQPTRGPSRPLHSGRKAAPGLLLPPTC